MNLLSELFKEMDVDVDSHLTLLYLVYRGYYYYYF